MRPPTLHPRLERQATRVWLTCSSVLVAMLTLTLTQENTAFADIAGPRRVCDITGKPCSTCVLKYSPKDDEEAEYKRCVATASAKGLEQACSDDSHTVSYVYYCPSGVTIGQRIEGAEPRGCGCVTVGGNAGHAELLASTLALSGLALLYARRRTDAARK